SWWLPTALPYFWSQHAITLTRGPVMTRQTGEHRSSIDNCPPRRRPLLPTVCAAASAAAVAALLSACGATAPPTPAGGARAGHIVQVRAGSRAVSVCLDGTSSSAWPYAIQMRGLVADAIAGWAGQPTADPTTAMPPRPSLDFVLRSVTTISYST